MMRMMTAMVMETPMVTLKAAMQCGDDAVRKLKVQLA
jgi:hypothetical protein